MSVSHPPTLPDGASVQRDIAYVSDGHARQRLDLYLPAGSFARPLPLIVWVHGGAFRMGSKEGDPDNPLPLAYLSRGFAVASINYRLSQHAIWPAQIEDCKSALRWLRAHAAAHGIDPARIAAWGPSAGGHLAAMLGTAGHVRAFDTGPHAALNSSVSCVVDYYGPTDFLQMDAQRPPDGMLHDTPDSPESELIGGPIQDNKDATARANPVRYVTPAAPPFLIVHGDADPLVPHGQSVLLRDALAAAGADVTLYTVRGGGHGHFTDPAVPAMTQAFLERHLR
jgi:acetyl esterase/lipase